MDHPSYRSRRKANDIETDDVPDGYPHHSVIATNFSTYSPKSPNNGEDEIDGTYFLKRDSLVPRGGASSIYPNMYQHRKDVSPQVSPTSRCDSYFDSGCDTLGSGLKSHARIDSACFSCDSLGIDLDVLEIRDSLHEDVGSPTAIQLTRIDSIPEICVVRDAHLFSVESAYESQEQRSIPSITETQDLIHKQNLREPSQQTILLQEIAPLSPKSVEDVPNEELFVQNDEGDTFLHFAIYTDNQELFNNVITKVTHLKWLNIQNNNQQTALHLAVIQNQPHNVRRLVSWGASIDIRDRNGHTALHIACDRLRMECVLALTTHLERRDVKEVPYTVPFQRIPQNQDILNYDGKTCMHLAAEKAYLPLVPEYHSEQKNYLPIVHHLLHKCGANINAQEGKAGETVLHQAVQAGHVKLVEYLLLSRHIKVNSTRYDGAAPYQLAVGAGHVKIIKMLLREGAHDYFESDNNTEEKMDVESDDTDGCCASPPPCVVQSQDHEFAYDDIKIGGELLRT